MAKEIEINHTLAGVDLIVEVEDIYIDQLIEEQTTFLSGYSIGRIVLDDENGTELDGKEYDRIADELTVDDSFLEKVFEAATNTNRGIGYINIDNYLKRLDQEITI